MSIDSLNEFIMNIINDEFIKFIENIDNIKDYRKTDIENLKYEREYIIHHIFWEENSRYINILDYHISHFKKAKIILSMLVYLTQHNVLDEDYMVIFNEEKNCFEKLLQEYFYNYISSEKLLYESSILYYEHLQKHNNLINLYNLLGRKNKKKKTIFKILNKKFNQDITESILKYY